VPAGDLFRADVTEVVLIHLDGAFTFIIKVTDGSGQSATQQFSLAINDGGGGSQYGPGSACSRPHGRAAPSSR
jgi:hypothetical protein